MRRALAIDEQSYGTEHPNVAIRLNNLAQLLQATNRLAEAEPLMRRVISIIQKFGEATGYEHPHRRGFIENYRGLLEAMNLSQPEIEAKVREVLRTGLAVGLTSRSLNSAHSMIYLCMFRGGKHSRLPRAEMSAERAQTGLVQPRSEGGRSSKARKAVRSSRMLN